MKNLPDGYEDLFDEDGADPKAVKGRARFWIGEINLTKKYAKYLIRERMGEFKDNIKEIDTTIEELKGIVKENKSDPLKRVIKEKRRERKKLRGWIKNQQGRLEILEKTFSKEISPHKDLIERLKSPQKEIKVERTDYIG